VFAGVGYVVVRASLRPLRDVEDTAAAIAAGDLARRVPHGDPRTEVGRLSGALNTMLAEIETAFEQRAVSEAAARRSEERMRRFVADASHELRTPLTTIRGFAELYRQGAARSEADLARLMRRIEDEANRMGLLVEDLLLLARLDQQRPLAQLPVDVLALAGDAVHDAQAVAPDRAVTLEVGRTDPPPIVIGDEARLRQVLANLIGNALQHTPAGTPVTVRVTTAPAAPGGRAAVHLAVADAGPGLSEDDAARVFERFFRADPARSRDEGGTGLGLAIVAALVAGHGGSVRLDTAAGTGATFTVELPLAE
jgi:two-component system OmpR family sensor kinase